LTVLAVIPARFASVRFPGKPLARETGKYLIQHVFERVRSARCIDRVLVATDDQRIADAVRSFGGEARLTRPDHPSGTDRVAEVATTERLLPADIVLNVQGDEPEIDPRSLDRLVERLRTAGEEASIATLAAPFRRDGPHTGPGSPDDPNCVKVVVDQRGRALYFSRSLVPYPRGTGGRVDRPESWLLHLGVYAFRASELSRLCDRSAAPGGRLEQVESLEQLRWLERGWRIVVETVEHPFVGVDTPEDYAAFVRRESARAAAVEAPRSRL